MVSVNWDVCSNEFHICCCICLLVKSCPFLVAPTNGMKNSNDTYCGHTVEFNCDACYELTGNSPLTCLPNQTWSGEEPNCNGQCKLGFVLK